MSIKVKNLIVESLFESTNNCRGKIKKKNTFYAFQINSN